MQFKSYFCSCLSCFSTSVLFFPQHLFFESFMCFHLFYPVLMNHVTWCLTSPYTTLTHAASGVSTTVSRRATVTTSFSHILNLSITPDTVILAIIMASDEERVLSAWFYHQSWGMSVSLEVSLCFHIISLKSLTGFFQTGSKNSNLFNIS